MRVWRLCRRIHAAFDGEGSRLFGGRWSQPGVAAVYTSGTASLAALEYLVHLTPARAPADLVLIAATIPEQLEITAIAIQELPAGWRTYPAPELLAALGTSWARAGATPILRVPSAVVPQESNYILNPAHPDFRRLTIAAPERFSFDPRPGRPGARARRRPRR